MPNTTDSSDGHEADRGEHSGRYDAVVVGAGPAGVAVGAALAELDLACLVVNRDGIGASFRAWPDETRLLTPSFASNSFGGTDLNAVAPRTSPAFSLGREHPNGEGYADYLEGVVELYDVPVETGVEVTEVERIPADGSALEIDDPADDPEPVALDGGATAEPFRLSTTDGSLVADHVVWAAGEFGSPRKHAFTGAAEHGVHYGEVDSWAAFAAEHGLVADEGSGKEPEGESVAETGTEGPVVVVGGFESGVDAAVALINLGTEVVLVDSGDPWNYTHPDPSEALSPYTRERLDAAAETGRLSFEPDTDVIGVDRVTDGYELRTADGESIRTDVPPVLATGFEPTLGPVADAFADGDRGYPALTEVDESTTTPGLFLAGPAVTHDGIRFCFIYKFRQRAPVVAATIAERCGVDTDPLERWREENMYLDDLSCCEPDVCDC